MPSTTLLTLHVEAETIEDLLRQLDHAVSGLLFAGDDNSEPSARASFTADRIGAAAKPASTTPKISPRRRGRPRKRDAAPTVEAADLSEEVSAGEPAAAEAESKLEADEDGLEGSATVSAPACQDGVGEAATVAPLAAARASTPPAVAGVGNLTPAEARAKGIEMVTQHFARHPETLPQIMALSQALGVKMFADVPDERAHEFLAQVTLLVNGTAAALEAI